MSSFSRHWAALGMAILVSGAMWAAAPALAVERPTVTGDVAKPAAVKYHGSQHSRRAVVRARPAYVQRVAAMRRDGDCFGFWCRVPFVLMLGIGY